MYLYWEIQGTRIQNNQECASVEGCSAPLQFTANRSNSEGRAVVEHEVNMQWSVLVFVYHSESSGLMSGVRNRST